MEFVDGARSWAAKMDRVRWRDEGCWVRGSEMKVAGFSDLVQWALKHEIEKREMSVWRRW